MIKIHPDDFDPNSPRLVRAYGLNMHGLLYVFQHCEPFLRAVEKTSVLEQYSVCLQTGNMPQMPAVLRRLCDMILPANNLDGEVTDIIVALQEFCRVAVCDGTYMQMPEGSSAFEDLVVALLGVQTKYAEDLDAKLGQANAYTNALARAWRTTFDPHPRRARNS
jgi:hypothetical protein